jgi:hypothetical protein
VETYVYEVIRPGEPSLWFPVAPADARVAITTIGGTGPGQIQLFGDWKTTNKVSVYWTATGNDGYIGKAKEFDLRWSTGPITEANWFSQNRANTPKPGNPGTVHNATITNLMPCTWHYFAIRAIDYEGNYSPISNLVSTKTLCSGGGGLSAEVLPSSLEFGLREGESAVVNGRVSLAFGIPASMAGKGLDLTIYDLFGRRVRTLTQGQATPGRFTADWNVDSETGARAGAGVYFARLRVGAQVLSVRLVTLSGS